MTRSATKIGEIKATSEDRLEVALERGGIRLEGWQRNLVSVTCPLGREAGRGVRVERSADGVRVTTGERPKGDLRGELLVIKVPVRCHCNLSTHGGGLVIENISGEVYGRTWGGNLSLRGVAGKVDLATGAGRVRLRDCAVVGRVETQAGSIQMLRVVSATPASDHSGQAPGGKLRLRSFAGSIDADEVLGTTELTTFHGSIRVGLAKGSLKATTHYGKVLVRELQGSAVLSTCHGPVQLKKIHVEPGIRRELDIDANGKVSLTLIPPVSLDLDIELARTRVRWRLCMIVSDFELEQLSLPGLDRCR